MLFPGKVQWPGHADLGGVDVDAPEVYLFVHTAAAMEGISCSGVRG